MKVVWLMQKRAKLWVAVISSLIGSVATVPACDEAPGDLESDRVGEEDAFEALAPAEEAEEVEEGLLRIKADPRYNLNGDEGPPVGPGDLAAIDHSLDPGSPCATNDNCNSCEVCDMYNTWTCVQLQCPGACGNHTCSPPGGGGSGGGCAGCPSGWVCQGGFWCVCSGVNCFH
jgi:hypothetical protein